MFGFCVMKDTNPDRYVTLYYLLEGSLTEDDSKT